MYNVSVQVTHLQLGALHLSFQSGPLLQFLLVQILLEMCVLLAEKMGCPGIGVHVTDEQNDAVLVGVHGLD